MKTVMLGLGYQVSVNADISCSFDGWSDFSFPESRETFVAVRLGQWVLLFWVVGDVVENALSSKSMRLRRLVVLGLERE